MYLGVREANAPSAQYQEAMKPVMDNVFDEIDDAGREVLKKITIDDIDRKIFKREG